MKKLLWAAVIFPFLAMAAWGMQQSQVPPKFSIPWGNSASATYLRSIPTPSQIGIQNCAASLTDGFPPLSFVPATAGGCPPFGADFNGILKQVTQWSRWQGAGAAPLYNSSFSASIGGYPSGAVLANASTPGCFWVSTTDNNASDPDTGGANWNASCPGGGIGGTLTQISGNPNTQAVAATPFVRATGARVTYVAGFSNTGPMQVNVNGAGLVNFFRRSQLGATMSVGGETVAGQVVVIDWDGTQWQCISCEVAHVGDLYNVTTTALRAGHLVADGSCVAQATYPDLFSVLSTSWGSCSAGNFALPDLRGRMTAGYNSQGSNGAASRMTSAGSSCAATTVGVGCGAQNHTMLLTELVAHTHTYNSPINSAVASSGSNIPGNLTGGAATGSTGSSAPFPILNPVQTVMKIIKF